MAVDDRLVEVYTVRDGAPLSLRVQIERALALQRDAWQVRIETRSEMTADATHFHVHNYLKAYEGDTLIFARSWTKAIPRRLV